MGYTGVTEGVNEPSPSPRVQTFKESAHVVQNTQHAIAITSQRGATKTLSREADENSDGHGSETQSGESGGQQ
jgi:hypothetical protein